VDKVNRNEFKILLTGENVTPEITKWEVVIPNTWSNDEDTMLNLIKIKRVE